MHYIKDQEVLCQQLGFEEILKKQWHDTQFGSWFSIYLDSAYQRPTDVCFFFFDVRFSGSGHCSMGPCTVYKTHKLLFLTKLSLKMDPIALFIHLKFYFVTVYSLFNFQQNKHYPNILLVNMRKLRETCEVVGFYWLFKRFVQSFQTFSRKIMLSSFGGSHRNSLPFFFFFFFFFF